MNYTRPVHSSPSSTARFVVPDDAALASAVGTAINAAFLAAGEGAIRMEHILRAARREYSKIEKLALESEFGSMRSGVKQ